MVQGNRGKQRALGLSLICRCVSHSLCVDEEESPSSPSQGSDSLDSLTADDDDTTRLDELERDIRRSTTDPFLCALRDWQENQRATNNSASTGGNPSARMSTRSQTSNQTSNQSTAPRIKVYRKNGSRWAYYVIFNGPNAGIYAVW